MKNCHFQLVHPSFPATSKILQIDLLATARNSQSYSSDYLETLHAISLWKCHRFLKQDLSKEEISFHHWFMSKFHNNQMAVTVVFSPSYTNQQHNIIWMLAWITDNTTVCEHDLVVYTKNRATGSAAAEQLYNFNFRNCNIKIIGHNIKIRNYLYFCLSFFTYKPKWHK